MYSPRETRIAVVLRDNAVIAEPKPQAGADDIEEELHRFDARMRRARGLASKTCRDHIRIVRCLLRVRFADQPLEFSALRPDEVRQFIAGQLKHSGTKSRTRALASGLRACFRYRAGCGDHTDALASVIGSPAEWSLGSLPQSLSDEEVNRLLESSTPAGCPVTLKRRTWRWPWLSTTRSNRSLIVAAETVKKSTATRSPMPARGVSGNGGREGSGLAA